MGPALGSPASAMGLPTGEWSAPLAGLEDRGKVPFPNLLSVSNPCQRVSGLRLGLPSRSLWAWNSLTCTVIIAVEETNLGTLCFIVGP